MRICSIGMAFPTGPCFGVNRALGMAYKILHENKSLYMFHPIIHNPRVVKELEDMGVHITVPDETPKGATVLLSAHGTPLYVKENLKNKEVNVVDAVCPLVELLHKKALDLINEGRFLVIVGDSKHQELKALVSYLPDGKYTFLEDIDNIPFGMPLGVVFQTTYEYVKVSEVFTVLYKYSDDIRVVNTICPATRGRQGVLERVVKSYDLIVVVGGKNSANTRRLYEKAKRYTNALWVESPEEICLSGFSWEKECISVLIVGGASTPIKHLVDIYLHLKNMIQ